MVSSSQYALRNSLCAAVRRPDAPRSRAAQHRGTKHCRDSLCILARAARGTLERARVGGCGLAGALQPVSEHPQTRPCLHSCPLSTHHTSWVWGPRRRVWTDAL
eukprot:234929-Chlamydomonas_euryale.AAC.1